MKTIAVAFGNLFGGVFGTLLEAMCGGVSEGVLKVYRRSN